MVPPINKRFLHFQLNSLFLIVAVFLHFSFVTSLKSKTWFLCYMIRCCVAICMLVYASFVELVSRV